MPVRVRPRAPIQKMSRLNIENIEAIVMDFDGVLTDNYVYLSEDGLEMVRCNRSDGMAIKALREKGLKLFILSSEENKVVKTRADKLSIRAIYGIQNKLSALKELSIEESFNLSSTLYVGNDVNDLNCMKACKFSACPIDSHQSIKKISTLKLKSKGGGGVIRELTEEILNVHIFNTLYNH